MAKAAYADGSGDPLSAGETLVQPDLADTLEAIRRGGPEAFYEGAIAEDLAAAGGAPDGRKSFLSESSRDMRCRRSDRASGGCKSSPKRGGRDASPR